MWFVDMKIMKFEKKGENIPELVYVIQNDLRKHGRLMYLCRGADFGRSALVTSPAFFRCSNKRK